MNQVSPDHRQGNVQGSSVWYTCKQYTARMSRLKEYLYSSLLIGPVQGASVSSAYHDRHPADTATAACTSTRSTATSTSTSHTVVRVIQNESALQSAMRCPAARLISSPLKGYVLGHNPPNTTSRRSCLCLQSTFNDNAPTITPTITLLGIQSWGNAANLWLLRYTHRNDKQVTLARASITLIEKAQHPLHPSAQGDLEHLHC